MDSVRDTYLIIMTVCAPDFKKAKSEYVSLVVGTMISVKWPTTSRTNLKLYLVLIKHELL